MACSTEFLTKKMEEIKITDDFFLGNYLSFEVDFLNNVIETFGQEIKDCEFLFYLHRSCETTTTTYAIARKLLKLLID